MSKLIHLLIVLFFTCPLAAQKGTKSNTQTNTKTETQIETRNEISSDSMKITPDSKSLKNRPPRYSGTFYKADPQLLKRDLEFLFSGAQASKSEGTLLALVSPHAGYAYSGEVAATSINMVDPNKQYKNIFIIGNSHRVSFQGAAIYTSGNFQTPLGEVKVNTELADKLIRESRMFIRHDYAHEAEHSLEVQLPLLQYHMKKDFQIIPILIGFQSESFARNLARALKPYLNEDNLFIISADFSHYPDYSDANEVDMNTARAICSNDADKFLTALKQNEEKNIPNLATSACAWPALLTLLYMTQENQDKVDYELVQYQNSGDKSRGDKSRVVGYCSIAVRKKDSKEMQTMSEFSLSTEDKKVLLKIARTTMDSYIRDAAIHKVDHNNYSRALQTHAGAFVTLHKEGKLRGCIGRFQPDKPLCEVVRDMAISASTKDYRFSPVKASELDEIDLEISVLTPLKPISDPEEIKLGQHGIYIKKGSSSGTFLPQVATETGWNLEEFLGHCARDKAHIGWEGWKEADLFTYEALIFTEEEFHHK